MNPEEVLHPPNTEQLDLQSHLETQLRLLASAFPTGPLRGLKLLAGIIVHFVVTSFYLQLQVSVPPEKPAYSP